MAAHDNAATAPRATQPGWRPRVPTRTNREPARNAAAVTPSTVLAARTASGLCASCHNSPAKAQPSTEARCHVAHKIRTLRPSSGGAGSDGTIADTRRCRKISHSPSSECTTPVTVARTAAVMSSDCMVILIPFVPPNVQISSAPEGAAGGVGVDIGGARGCSRVGASASTPS